MKRRTYSPPKFKKGQQVKLPNGEEKPISFITYLMGTHWYEIERTSYAENEIKAI